MSLNAIEIRLHELGYIRMQTRPRVKILEENYLGVAIAPDGSLMIPDDGSNSIWRVTTPGNNV